MIYAIAIITLLGGILFYSGIPWQDWPSLLTLTALLVYLQSFSVGIGGRMSLSLSTATIFPIIYLSGATPAMLISGLAGLVDGIRHKKTLERTLFNTSQLALSGLMGSLVFKHALQFLPLHGLTGVLAMTIGMITYIAVNILLVTLLVAIHRQISWRKQLAGIGFGPIYSSAGSGFIGILFTFFAISYKFWGLLAFSLLLVHLSELLKSAAEVRGERSKRRELEEELLIDEMTGANNFRFLTKWLGESLEERMAVLFIDLDDFKKFNDRYGHAEGDRVLKLVVETISNNIRANDRVIRYGGDEFVVLLPGMDSSGGFAVAQRIVSNLAKITSATWREPITVSIGIASTPQDTTDKHQLLLISDQAMYQAKHLGKNTVQVCSSMKGPA